MPGRNSRPISRDTPSPSASPDATPTVPPSNQRHLAVRTGSSARSVSGSKRKRADTNTGPGSASRRRTMEPQSETESDEPNDELEQDDVDGSEDEDEDYIYNPDQSLVERRRIQRGFRDLLKNVTDNRDEVLGGGGFEHLQKTITKANHLSKSVRQTNEATKDSRLLVTTTDLSYRKVARLTQGNLSNGIDVDEFVSKCITYMREGKGIGDDDAAELSSTQRQRRQSTVHGGEDEEELGDEGDMMNWQHLGRYAALPFIRRPALPGFLLGPLSVEKKVRKITKRTAPFRPDNLTETRPRVLDAADFTQKENDLTVICSQILRQLISVQEEAQNQVTDLIDDDMDEEEQERIMHQHGLRSTGGIDVMRFVVNPKSFGQTVENMFYVSFLIRDSKIAIDYDEHGLPALAPVEEDPGDDDRPRRDVAKHQAILSMDMETWRDIIETLKLTEPMIEHREENTDFGPGPTGWYT